jgi:predicted metal-dependent enzyme (double-stranded beta helix superfamily)
MAGDEYLLDTPVVRDFVAGVRAVIADAASPHEACDAIRPAFAQLLADPAWLPERYQEGDPESGMGGGIGQWLLFRAGDRSLSLFALVVPAEAQTPVHDHLAWGLVGLYRGTQDEDIYAERDGALQLIESRALQPGDFYALIPPTDDTGCVWRHAYDAHSGERTPFRSGYVNVPCEDD